MAKYKIRLVIVSNEAQKEFDKMASFIIAYQKSPKTIQKFRDNFKEKLEQIKKLPFSCPKSNKLKGTRKARFDKFGAFLYFVFNNTVFIVTFYDSRMK